MAETIAKPREDRVGLGIAMMLLAWFFFAFVDTSVKWLVIAGLPALQLAFMRYFGHVILSTLMIARSGAGSMRRPRKHLGLVVLRALLLVSATFSNFVALRYLSLTLTSSIMFSSPIIVSALSVPLLGERVGPWRWFAIILGFAGVLVVVRPFGADFHWASTLAIYNALALALFSIITRRLSGEVSAETMQFYLGVIGVVVLLPGAIWVWQTPQNALEWALLISIGFWGWIGHEFFARAHGFAEANALMPFTYTFLIYLTLSSFVVFGDLPDNFTILGAILIVASGLLIWWREKHRNLDNVRT